MAGEAFRLVIPQDMLNKLQTADEKLAQLGRTSQNTQSQVIAAFMAMAEGVNPFIQKLNEAQQALGNIKAFKGGDIKLGNIATEATKSADAVNELVQVIAKLVQENKKLQEQQLSSRGITIAQEGTLGKKESNLNYKSLTNDVKELHNAEMERGRELTRQNSQNIANQRVIREQLKQETNAKIAEARKATADIQILSKEEIAAWKRASNERIANDNDASKRRIAQQKRETNEIIAELNRESRERIKEANRIARLTRLPSTIDATTAQNIISKSGSAVSINQMLTSIKNLEKAKRDLDTTDKNYKKTLAEIDNALNQNKQSLRRLGVETENVRKHQSNLMNHAQQLRRALALVFSVSQITGYINKMIQVRGEFELQQRSLQAILQNKDEADKLWQQTVDLAVRSPFRVKELVSYTKQLAAYRVETEKLHDTTKMLSDVSAGLGVDMQRLILAYGQVKAANYLRGTELRQFSEAGINILGELAKYFTELEGRAVSVGEVFERVSKRMVAFSDVEEIFKRVTSEGGVFYRMQEIQSETVKGLISNLYDQVDLMLNDIGKSNNGYIKGAIGIVKTLVENWKYVAEAIKIAGSAWLIYKVQAQLAHEKNMLLAIDFGILTNASQKQLKFTQLLALSWKRVTLAVKTFTKALIANPILLAITAALYAATKLYSAWSKHQEQLEEITKQYKELRKEVTDISVKFTYASNVEEQKKELSKLIGVANDKYNLNVDIDVKGLDEQEVSEEFNNLRNEILNTMAFTEQMSKAIVESDAWYKWGDDIYGAFEKFSSSAQEYSNVIRNNNNAIIEFLKETGRFDDIAKKMFAERGEYVKNETELEYIDRLTLAYELYYKELVRGGTIIGKNGVIQRPIKEIKELQEAASEYVKAKEKAVKEFDEFANSFYIPSIITEENRTAYIKAAIDQKGFDDFTREMWYKLANQRFSVNITPTPPKKTDLDAWQKKYNDFIKTLDKFKNKEGKEKIILAEMTVDTNVEQYINILKGRIESVNKDIEAWDARNERARATYTKEQIDLMRLENAVREKGYKWLVYTKQKETGDGGRDIFADQLRVIKEMYQAYKDLNKTFDDITAKEGAMAKFGNAFKEAFGKTPKEMGFDLFSEEGVKKAYDYLIKHATDAKKKIQAELAKGEIEWEAKVKIKQEEDKELADQIADMFSGYELSLELQKLNIPSDLAKQLFNVDSLTLPELKTQLQGMESQFVGTDMEDEYREALRKVDEMERKSQEERLKKYVSFSRKALSERAKIKLQELQTIEDIEKTFAIKQEDSEEIKATKRAERARALAQAQKEANDAIQKLDWEDFKSSDTFNNIFDDLEYASDEVLKSVIQRLKDFKDQWKDMPFEQMRQVVDLLNKAEGALNEKSNPFVEAKRLRGLIKADGRTTEQAQVDMFNAEQMKATKENELAVYELFEQVDAKLLAATSLTTEQQKKYAEWQKLSVKEQKNLVQGVKDEIYAQQGVIDKANIQLNNAKKLKNAYEEQADAISKIDKMANDLYDSFKGLSEALGGDSDSPEAIFADMGMNMASTVMQTIKLQRELQAASVNATAFGAAMNATMGVIGWIVMAVQLLTQAISAMVKAHDNNLENQIQDQIERVEELEHSYKKLEKAIAEAYSAKGILDATENAQKNLDYQISSYRAMIAAEEQKKNTDNDRISEWERTIEELEEQREQLKKDMVESLGGYYDYRNVASDWASAWLDSFKETGNGLKGLQESFDEFIENLIVQQIAAKIAGKHAKNILDVVNNALEDGVIDKLEADYINTAKEMGIKAANAEMEAFASLPWVQQWMDGSTSNLSGLTEGIKGITESTAQIIEAYLNSLRFFVSEESEKISNIERILTSNEETGNPILSELRAQTSLVREIREVLGDVVFVGHSKGGSGLKVFMD